MRISPCALVIASLSFAPSALAINIGVRDDFQTGTVSEWYGGTTITPVTNGQIGATDQFITVQTAAASGAGSHLATHNSEPRWTGDYLGAGVTAITVDMRNQGTTTLQMRVVLFGLGNRWTSTTPVTLAPNSGWQHLTFPITQSSLSRVLGSGTYQDSLGSVSQIMFRHATGLSSGGTTVSATVGIDNVAAIPAPGAAGVLGVGAVLAGMRRRR